MKLTEEQLGEAVSKSQLGKYAIVRLALEWIRVIKQSEEYKKLTQSELINRALSDVVNNIATPEKIEELRKNMQKEAKSETSSDKEQKN